MLIPTIKGSRDDHRSNERYDPPMRDERYDRERSDDRDFIDRGVYRGPPGPPMMREYIPRSYEDRGPPSRGYAPRDYQPREFPSRDYGVRAGVDRYDRGGYSRPIVDRGIDRSMDRREQERPMGVDRFVPYDRPPRSIYDGLEREKRSFLPSYDSSVPRHGRPRSPY